MLTIKKNKFPTRLPDFELLGDTFSHLDKLFLGDDDFFSKNNLPRDFVFRNVKSNFLENDNSFILEIQIPGIDKKDINISIDDFNLKVDFNRKEKALEEGTSYKLREFNIDSFSRSFFLPKSSNLDKITSKCENGILFIDIPKKESEINKKRTIKIS